ncbi:MAG: SDR family oxidoreductase, partial [Elusimicrobiota bacterium]|nr:SDR family oxidoreductase [Elusimicrobiota bacterium]
MEQLKGKVCVVTGGAMGIGQKTAQTFAEEGAKVALVDVNMEKGKESAEEINKKNPGAAKFYACNLRKVQEIRDTVDAIYKDFGKIDAVTNIAGLANRTPNESITEEEWDLLTDVNLKAVFFMSQAVYRYMLKQGYGKIINLSSHRGTCTDGSHTIYDATKAGVQALARGFAVSGGSKGICSIAVAPGYVLTPMTAHNLDTPGWLDNLKSRVPLGRFIEMQEVANVLTFIVSDKSSGINGATIMVDGG